MKWGNSSSHKSNFNDLLIFDAHCDTANVIYDQSSYFNKDKNRQFTIKKALLLYNALEQNLFSSDQAVKVTNTSEMNSAIINEKPAKSGQYMLQQFQDHTYLMNLQLRLY